MDSLDQLMSMKAELMATTSTAGWSYIRKFAETVLKDLDREAIDEEDDDKAKGLRRDAKGARKHWNELLRRIEIAKNLDPEPTEDNFLEIVME